MRVRTGLGALAAVAACLTATSVHAFCGFYVSGADTKLFNDATQVALMREGTRTVLSMQNDYKGPPENFAMVVPVPVVLQKENVKTLQKELFQKLDTLSAPRLVEYWERDPCAPEIDEDEVAAPSAVYLQRGRAEDKKKHDDLGVKVEAQFVVGEYQIVILSAKDASGLETWLNREHYKIPAGAAPYFQPYVQSGSKFFVARVDVKKVKFEGGRAALSPLRFHYDTNELALPVRLGLINSSGTQDLIVYILGRGQRYEPANYPSVTIPTNIDLAEEAKDRFGAFYTALFDKTLEKNAKALVTEYAWDASTCDPCPGPTLDGGDLAALGADVLSGDGSPASRGKGRFGGGGFTLTRLHARYSRDSLGQDVVFKTAPPIVGGREVRGANGLEHGASSSSFNNFQGRYAIRHPWKGPIACEKPVRGIWGGPPNDAPAPPKAATKAAFLPRTNLALPQLVRSDVPELDLKPSTSPAPAAPSAAPTAPATPSVQVNPPKASGCGSCAAVGPAASRPGLLAGIGLALLAIARRRPV